MVTTQGFARHTICCANCGGMGHIYKNCNHPVTSFGIVCFRLKVDEVSQCIFPEYLMVQRKDSLSYVEFIRGKYDLERRAYIMQLLRNMTVDERSRLLTQDFPELWKSLWQINDCSLFEREFHEAKSKFELMTKGYLLKRNNGDVIFFNMASAIADTKSELAETEWGFPKGRRNINEHDFACAIREFSEETGMRTKYLQIMKNHKPYEEVFSGSNYVRYRHVYFLAMCTSQNDKIIFAHAPALREIRAMKWMRYTEAQEKIRHINIERKELFRRINSMLIKTICKPVPLVTLV